MVPASLQMTGGMSSGATSSVTYCSSQTPGAAAESGCRRRGSGGGRTGAEAIWREAAGSSLAAFHRPAPRAMGGATHGQLGEGQKGGGATPAPGAGWRPENGTNVTGERERIGRVTI